MSEKTGNTGSGSTEVLSAEKISAGYGTVMVLHDLSLTLRPGEVVALLGSNGAGKSTTLKALAGEVRPSAGEISWEGGPAATTVHRRAAAGLRHIPERRAIFAGLTVADNLDLGVGSDRPRALELFPELTPLLRRQAQLLSGGEQQMLIVARALSANPKVLLADELSLGLAPLIVRRLLTAVRRAADEQGVAVLLVEQQFRAALDVADRGYVLQRGRLVLEGTAAELLLRLPEIEMAYLDHVKPVTS